MNRKIKITLIVIGILATGTCVFIAGGLYTMEIEDHYGDNQDIYYKSRQGDLAVNRDTKELWKIEKTRKRIYTVQNADTVDMWDWLDKNTIEIYRPVSAMGTGGVTYEDIENLINEKKLEFVIKNR